MLAEWGRARSAAPMPPVTEQLGLFLQPMRRQLLILSVDVKPQPQFLKIRYVGEYLRDLWPTNPLQMQLGNPVTPFVETECFPDYLYVLLNQEPHFHSLSICLNDGAAARLDRLLLPYGTRGRMTCIVCYIDILRANHCRGDDVLLKRRELSLPCSQTFQVAS